MHALRQDLRYGFRLLARNPGFTAVAVLTLALGIGATTVMFSVVYAALLDPFPYAKSHRLAQLVEYRPKLSQDWFNFANVPPSVFLDLREQNHVFDHIAGGAYESALLTGSGAPENLTAFGVTDNFFGVLGVPPLIGRSIDPNDCRPGAPPVVVVSYKGWQSRFGADQGIVGRTLVLNHQPATVVGVMPRRFTTYDADIWHPACLSHGKAPGQPLNFLVFGYVKPGASIHQANAELAGLSKRLAAIYPKDFPDGLYYGAVLLSDVFPDALTRKSLYILLAAVGLLLLIACVNVANLLLARASTRAREFAVRAALGAGRGRLIRQLLIESLLLGVGGSILGSLLAWDVLGGLVAVIPPDMLPSEAEIRINGPVLLFTLGAAFLSTLLFGLTPALVAVRRDPQVPLKASGRTASESSGLSRLRNLLVVSEVALSLVLLTGGALLIRSFLALHQIEFGYNPNNVLVANAELPEERYKSAEQRIQFYIELLRRVRSLPGVVSASLGDPPSPFGWGVRIEIDGKRFADREGARIRSSGGGYFGTLGIPLLQGRTISEEDFLHRQGVAVVNRKFASTYFGGESPLGKHLKLKDIESGRPFLAQDPALEIVGVVGDTLTWTRDFTPWRGATIYIPFAEKSIAGLPVPQLLVRTLGDPAHLVNSVRREAMALDKELPVSGAYFGWTLQDMQNVHWYAEPRFFLTILTALALLGLALASVGVYGVLSYSVSRRTHEIGVRMALGAKAADVRWWVLRAGLRWLLVGIGLGVPASIALVKILQNRIWGIKSGDPLTLAVVCLLLTAVGLAACYVPARRATKVDPMVALRYE